LALLAPFPLFGQRGGEITGIVPSTSGQPLVGAEVTVQGTRLGTITASNGR